MSLYLSLFQDLPESHITEISPVYILEPKPRVANRTVAEYFAGIGLVRLGLEKAGWNIVFANDVASAKYEMYSAYFQGTSDHYQVKDIFGIESASVPKTTLATSCFPCIDLSLAGNQNGLNGKHSSAFWGFIRILQEQGEQKPPLVMLENVSGWLTANKGVDFRLTIQELNKLGYCCDVYSLNAISFTPQSRPRVFIIGVKLDNPNGDLSKLEQRPSSLSNSSLKKAVVANKDLSWHFLDTPSPPPHKTSGLSSIVENIVVDDPRWWSQYEVNRHLEMMALSHRARIDKLVSQKKINYRTIFRRMRNGQQRAEVRKGDTAGCLRASRGGSSRQILIEAGNGKLRMRQMTPREYARLQGVPDDYPIPSNNLQALTGFGDAVCVPLITWIAEEILNPLVSIIR